jgi:hypothetical protein
MHNDELHLIFQVPSQEISAYSSIDEIYIRPFGAKKLLISVRIVFACPSIPLASYHIAFP